MNEISASHPIEDEVKAFLVERRQRGLAPNSLEYYSIELGIAVKWLRDQGISCVEQVTPEYVRAFLLWLKEVRGRKPGGQHGSWRAIRVFFNWWESEMEVEGWKNPMKKVAAPKLEEVYRPGVGTDDFEALVGACEQDFYGVRNKAVLMFLLDTGVRASELCAMNVGSVNLETGTAIVKRGKGGKDRAVFIGVKCRRELRRYLRLRASCREIDPLFAHKDGTSRLNRKGLEVIVNSTAEKAGITAPSLHDFRRAFAASMLKQGADVVTISRLLGHSTIDLVARYARQSTDDLHRKHDELGPLDHLR